MLHSFCFSCFVPCYLPSRSRHQSVTSAMRSFNNASSRPWARPGTRSTSPARTARSPSRRPPSTYRTGSPCAPTVSWGTTRAPASAASSPFWRWVMCTVYSKCGRDLFKYQISSEWHSTSSTSPWSSVCHKLKHFIALLLVLSTLVPIYPIVLAMHTNLIIFCAQLLQYYERPPFVHYLLANSCCSDIYIYIYLYDASTRLSSPRPLAQSVDDIKYLS